MDCNDCLSAETVVLLMTGGFIVFHIRMVQGKKYFWYVCGQKLIVIIAEMAIFHVAGYLII